ncbi:MAG: type 4a pilus biogenesis protein PilO [Clostridia bacterium]|nr:type 4a pilus biogenesis protein PilO [Clostridia bacterium]
MNPNRKNILLLLVIICSLAVLAWWFGAFLLRSSRAPEDLKLLRERVSTARGLLEQKDRLDQEIGRLEETVALWESRFYRLPRESALAELVAALDRLAAGSGLSVREKRLHRRLPAVEGWEKVGVTINGRGEFAGVTGFLSSLVREEKVILVEKIQLAADPRGGLLSYQITLTTLTGGEGMD